jgi:parallel beta-helix repeat protein
MTWFRPRVGRRSPRAKPARPLRYRPCLEPLEDRLALAVFTVISAGDSGAGTGLAGDLRYCLSQANATPGLDTIQFAIPGSGPHTINPTSALPVITDAVFLDGYTQPGASPNTLAAGDNAVLAIELNGAAAGATANGLTIQGASNCRIRGLAINRFGAAGIFIRGGSDNVVEGNFIGTDPTGLSALGNQGGGVNVRFGSSGNLIGGTTPAARNLISGNANGDGVDLVDVGTNNNRVQGNFIGTDATGTRALPNTGIGGIGGGGRGGSGVFVFATASNNLIGGTDPGAGNLISGNQGQGIYLQLAVTGNTIQGNFIGTDVTGTAALGNHDEGVYLFGTGTETNNTIGGTAPGAGNLISGNGSYGVRMRNPGNFIQGNLIGTDASGTTALANAEGILIQTGALTASSGNLISGNLVSGNRFNGIDISGSRGYRVEGNFIGTNRSGTGPLANGASGVLLSGAATLNTIGGTAGGAGNVIAFNRKGVVIVGSGAAANRVLGNSIFANAGPGIDLGDDGVTLNDAAGHSGPNNFPNFPVLTQVTDSGNGRTVFGHLSSTPNTTFRVEFFANDAYDPSGYGEGQVYLGFVDVTTDASGHASFSFAYTSDAAHPYLTSTATGPSGTSELSGRDLPPVNRVSGPQTTDENVPLMFGGATALSVSDPDNNATDPLQITLTVNHGTLTLANLAGLTASGNGTSSLTCTGTLAALNAALEGLTYTPAPFYDGPDALTLTTSDLVAPELGGPGTASSRGPLTVVDVVNPPSLTVSDATGNEGQAIPLLIHAGAVDTDGSEALSLQIRGLPATATLSAGTRDQSGVWTLTADQLNGLTLDAADNFTAALTVTATTTQRATGATATRTQTLLVTAANVAPTATLSNDGPTDEGGRVAVFFAGPSDPSPADTAAGFRYSFALKAGDLATSYAAASPAARLPFAFADSGTYTVHGRVFDKDGGFTDFTTTVIVRNIVPMATLSNDGPIDEGGSVTVLFTDPFDPAPADKAAGFRYSFARSPADLATDYAAASPDAQQHFAFEQAGTYTVYGRVFDRDGGFTDSTTTVVVRDLPPASPAAPTPPSDALPPAVPPAPPSLALPVLPPQPTAPGLAPLVPPLPSGPGQAPGSVGGDTQAGDPAGPSSREAQVELGSSLAGSNSFDAPTVSSVMAAQAWMRTRRDGAAEDRPPLGPEAQAFLQATQVIAANLDGDDSVRVVEILLQRNAEPDASGIRLDAGSDAPAPVDRAFPPPATPAGPDAAPADAPAPRARLVQWLAVPAGATLAALGWLCYRARRGRTGKPAAG